MKTKQDGETMAAEPEADQGFQDTVLALLTQMSDSISGLQARVDAVENSGPKFVPASVETYGNASERMDAMQAAPADGIPRSQTLPMTSSGDRVPDFMMRQYPPRFGTGMRVRLNPNAVPHGHDTKTRGEMMVEKGTPDGIGEIIDRKYLTNQGTWKYKVRFPSKTITGSNGGLTMLHEPELMLA